MLTRARNAGVSVSFDPNLRPSLWSSETEMRDTLNELVAHSDWVLPGLAESRRLTGRGTPETIADFYLDRGAQAVIIKLGPEGSYYRAASRIVFPLPSFVVDKVEDTVGAGDGFAVGVVSALLEAKLPAR